MFPYFDNDKQSRNKAAFRKAVANFMALQHITDKESTSAQTAIHYFIFDPNTISTEKLQRLGISNKVATIIKHYREAGGHFYKKEDLKKIYGLSDKTYQRLAPYVSIQQPKNQKTVKQKNTFATEKKFTKSMGEDTFTRSRRVWKPIVIDINKADSATWARLYGIGSVLSARIVRFRKALGGFYKTAQIADVYGLPDSTFQRIKKQLNISTLSLKKLNINTASVEKLKSHPYINYRLANAIKAFRDMHGRYDSLIDLKQVQLVDDQIYRKLVPYLTVK